MFALRLVVFDEVSVLFNEPKLLKCCGKDHLLRLWFGFSALQRAEIAEMHKPHRSLRIPDRVSVLFNEQKLLKLRRGGL